MSKKTINIYWAPLGGFLPEDWTMLYYPPENLYEIIRGQAVDGIKKDSFLICPAVTEKFKKTYVLKNTLTSKFSFEEDGTVQALHHDNAYIGMRSIRKPTLKNTNMFQYNMQWIFFSDESVNVEFTPPYFHEPKYMKYGTVMPGSFDIGSWFRSYNAEFMTWNTSGYFEISEDEPIAYITVNSDKNINFIRFNMNDTLKKYADACSNSPKTIGSNLPLIKRYERFNKSKMRDSVLSEIKKNIVSS